MGGKGLWNLKIEKGQWNLICRVIFKKKKIREVMRKRR
jgi:hypothetical protein